MRFELVTGDSAETLALFEEQLSLHRSDDRSRHLVLDYTFTSFADGSPVNLAASVDGTEVFNGGGFTWDNNGGEFYMEIGTLENTRLDNLAISTIPEPSGALLGALGCLALMQRRRR